MLESILKAVKAFHWEAVSFMTMWSWGLNEQEKKINGTKMNYFPFIDFVALQSHIRGTRLLFKLFGLLVGSPVNTEGDSEA